MRKILPALVLLATPAFAEEPIDPATVDKAMYDDMFGTWKISNESGKKHCNVTLKRDVTIGGMEIDVSKRCIKLFPVMDNVTAWRLMEGWAIVFADAERHELIRFYTPDERYISKPETDGIFTIEKVEGK